LRRLDPRQRVYFFLSGSDPPQRRKRIAPRLITDASEFARLDSAIPPPNPISTRYRAFIEARYTPRPVEPEKPSGQRILGAHPKSIAFYTK